VNHKFRNLLSNSQLNNKSQLLELNNDPGKYGVLNTDPGKCGVLNTGPGKCGVVQSK